MSVSINNWLSGWRISLLGLAFVVLAELVAWPLSGWPLRVVNTISAPGAMIVIFLLPIVGFDGPEHPLVSACLVIAFNTLIYSALFALFLRLTRFVMRRGKRV